MKLGLSVPCFGEPGDFVTLARRAEQSGWDGLFLWDHLVFLKGADIPIVDPWVTLGAVAQATDRLVLGTLITPLARRRPAKVAREVTTLDHLAGGRTILGIGLGSPSDADFAAFGDSEDESTRGAILDEAIEIVTGLQGAEPYSFSGRHLEVSVPTTFMPPPVQRPRVPVWVAGFWPAPRPFRRAARWDGVVPLVRSDPPTLSVDEVRAVRSFVGEERSSQPPKATPGDFDIVVLGATNPGAKGSALVAEHRDAGATWWVETTMGYEGWYGEMLTRIDAGPPGAG